MKKLLFGLAIIMCCYAANAQSLTINNNVMGDTYFRVYTATPTTCTLLTEYVEVMVPAFNSVFVDLTDPTNWNGGNIPTAFDLLYAEASRDPLCPGTAGWGALAGSCGYGNSYFDQVTVGNTGCFYSGQDCIEISTTVSSCGGYAAGDVVGVIYTVSGVDVTIDVNP